MAAKGKSLICYRRIVSDPFGETLFQKTKMRILNICEMLLVVCAVVSLCLVFFDASVRIDTVDKISDVSFADPSEQIGRSVNGTRVESLCLPSSSVDAHWWILHAERMLRDGGWRIRSTDLDNAPSGREVHWSSLLLWMLAAGASLVALFNGQPPAENVAEVALYIGPVAMVWSLILLAGLAWRAFGRTAALVLSCAFLTSPYIYRTFHAGEADHHGLVLVFCMASAIALLGGHEKNTVTAPAKRGGRKMSRNARAQGLGWFWLAGAFGAAALWVSAATAIPFLAGCGLGGVASAACSRKWGGIAFPHRGWLVWGVAGGIASLGFYAMEYFPANARWRLEVNHPLYAFAWACGGFLVSRITSMLGGGRFFQKGFVDRWLVAIALAVAMIPVALIIFIPENVFWVRNRFLLALHKEHILEFQSFLQMLGTAKGLPLWLFDYTWTFFALFGAFILGARKPSSMAGIIWIVVPALAMQALAFQQVRWGTAAAGFWVVVAIALIVASRHLDSRTTLRLTVAATACAWIATVFAMAPRLVSSVVRYEECLRAPLKEDVGNGLLLRDIAHRLIRSGVTAPPVVLTGPNSSTLLAYFGNIRTLGTLYWENNRGLHRAARIFASKDENEAKQRILEEGVTHIVIPSWENFGSAYARLYSLVDPSVDPELGAPFFKAIVEDQLTPKWLRPFAYPIPSESGIDGASVRIFAVLPQQNDFEFHFFQGAYFFEVGKFEDAARHMREALAIRPSSPAAMDLLRQAEKGAANPLPAPDQPSPQLEGP
jgi:hypothetical protein